MQTSAGRNVHASGHLDVGDGHALYWEDWGNPDARTAIMHLHGGPGSAFNDRHKAIYDPTRHRVIFADQRGCGRSTPFAGTQSNTTTDLVADIDRLRQHIGLAKVYLAGGSWGSTLALLYAIGHPESVRGLFIWSIYLARQFDTNFFSEGYARHFLPAEWDRFISRVPAQLRHNGRATTQWYADQIHSADHRTAQAAAFEWALWESSLMSINYDPVSLEAELRADESVLALARLETHYFLNNCFIPENHIIDHLSRIRGLPAVAVHGRFDFCTPASAAYDLAQAYGPNLRLKFVNSSHTRSDPEMLAALQAAASQLGEVI